MTLDVQLQYFLFFRDTAYKYPHAKAAFPGCPNTEGLVPHTRGPVMSACRTRTLWPHTEGYDTMGRREGGVEI